MQGMVCRRHITCKCSCLACPLKLLTMNKSACVSRLQERKERQLHNLSRLRQLRDRQRCCCCCSCSWRGVVSWANLRAVAQHDWGIC